jgi:hypothetical protein
MLAADTKLFLYQLKLNAFRISFFTNPFKNSSATTSIVLLSKEEIPISKKNYLVYWLNCSNPNPYIIIAADFNQCFIYWYRLYKIVLAVTAIIETNIKETM